MHEGGYTHLPWVPVNMQTRASAFHHLTTFHLVIGATLILFLTSREKLLLTP